MAFQGHTPTGHPMRPGPPGMMPPAGMFHHPHPSFGPPPMMMMHHMPQPVHPGMMPPGMHPMPVPPLGMPPPIMMVPHARGPPGPLISEPIIKVPVPVSTSTMKVATTVFVGNISEKASDTLIRQILLRCGPIEGWKRVQDATGKLQGFGFCEYADPESTLRALRLLHNLKLGEKALVAKVDAKTRKDLLKYLITKKLRKNNKTASDEEVQAEVNKLEEDKDAATAALIKEVPEEAKSEDGRIWDAIKNLLKDYLSILSCTKSNEEIQRERDVKESILFMAKQSGNIDPNSTLEDMDMEDDMKTLVSDEIKRFRESYKRSDEARKERKARDKDRDKEPDSEKEQEKEGEDRRKPKVKESNVAASGVDSPHTKERMKRERSNSPAKSPLRRPKSPVRSRSQERQEKEKRREAMRQREKEDMLKDEEEYEERMRQRRARERDKAYKQRLANWEGREYRKEKDHEKDVKKEKEKREDMDRERKHLGDFLAEYDDSKDDMKYYKGNAYARRRREREMEIDYDERDRLREKDELEELRLQVIERQARELLSGDASRRSSAEDSPQREEEEEDMDVPVKEEIEEDIPLTKSGYGVPPAYPPIQVHSAPSVNAPETSNFHPVPAAVDLVSPVLRKNDIREEISEGNSPASYNSPTQSKLTFGLKKTPSSSQSQSTVTGQPKSSKLDKIFTSEEDEVETKPKKKLVPIEYSDEEEEEPASTGRGFESSSGSGRKRSRRLSGKGTSRRISGDVGMVARGSLSAGDGLMEVKDRKLSGEERKKMIQTLVNNIPTSKEEVFRYQLKWDQIDKGLIENRVGPWINKKITEYIGEAEPILTEFICNKLSCHISPSDILNDISMVLDDEAEVFIVKLWRLLIYETEAKHLGIAKSY